MRNNNVFYNGPSFLSLLSLALIILKLCKVIDISWWLALAPIWIPIALVLGILSLIGLIYIAIILWITVKH